MPSDDLFTRDQVRRAALDQEEKRAGSSGREAAEHLVARSRQAMELAVGDVAARERDLAFLEAFTLGREPPLRPSIQDLERYAPRSGPTWYPRTHACARRWPTCWARSTRSPARQCTASGRC